MMSELGMLNENKKDDLKEGIKDGIKYYNGWQYRIKLEENFVPVRFAQVWMSEGIPFFIWAIPENEKIVRVGIISKNGRIKLNHFLAESKIKGEKK